MSTSTANKGPTKDDTKTEDWLSSADGSLYDLHDHPGRPMPNREATVKVVNALLHGKEDGPETETNKKSNQPSIYLKSNRPPLSNVYGDGPFLLSDIPQAAKGNNGKGGGIVLGIDEAGRGSLLGPMIYGCAYWSTDDEDEIPRDFNDSKQLTHDKRTSLFQKILETEPIGFGIRVLHASEISRNMLRRPEPYNLNQMSHNAAIDIIRHLQKAGVTNIDTCYIDTVGNPGAYKRLLEREFPNYNFVVESKADAKYAPCSAASVVAKVTRDAMMANWQFSEPSMDATKEFGSGYPSDPVCKKWMEDNLQCPLFCFPDVVRFSWGPAKNAVEESGYAVEFEGDEEEEEDGGNSKAALKRQRDQMSIFLGKQQKEKKVKRYPFFERRGLQIVTQL